MPTSLPITAVNHLTVTTRRLAASRKFYCDVLGFQEVPRPNFNFRGAWLFNFGLMIHIIESGTAGDPHAEIQTREPHLALHSDDLESCERLLQEHCIAYRKNEVPDLGIKQLFFQDPDGYHIEVGKYPPLPKPQ
ncbi:MAG: VOC family protein [Pirellulales bacterium]|nr:VOC family protein [Pirellulales bacterium]